MRRRPLALAITLGPLLWAGCAGTPRRLILPHDAPSHSLTLAQVAVRFTRDTLIQRGPDDYQTLLASGIPDAEIRDGTVAIGRVNCCHGPTEEANAIAFYLPAALGAEVGDLVEVRLGRPPEKAGGLGEANQATRVVQKRGGTGPCRWEPPQTGGMTAYGSVLFCDWMPEQGWVREGPTPTIHRSWIKKP
jgi:hypothetical protein